MEKSSKAKKCNSGYKSGQSNTKCSKICYHCMEKVHIFPPRKYNQTSSNALICLENEFPGIQTFSTLIACLLSESIWRIYNALSTSPLLLSDIRWKKLFYKLKMILQLFVLLKKNPLLLFTNIWYVSEEFVMPSLLPLFFCQTLEGIFFYNLTTILQYLFCRRKNP